jgi:phage terminase large subunit-like protein
MSKLNSNLIRKIERARETPLKSGDSLLTRYIFDDKNMKMIDGILMHDLSVPVYKEMSRPEFESLWTKTLKTLLIEHRGNLLFLDKDKREDYLHILAQAVYRRYKVNLMVKLICQLDLYFLTKVVLGYMDLSPRTHLPVCRHIQDNLTKCLVIMPRGFYKTTISTKSLSIWLIINDPNIRILITNATATNGELFLREIKSHFESNPRFRSLFKELIPTDFKKTPWASDKMQVQRDQLWSEPTIRTTGIEGNVTGCHFNVIIEDDLVNEDHITTPEMMSKPIDWHKMSHSLYVPTTNPMEKMNVIVGTRWSYYDFINYCMTECTDHKKWEMSCFDERGESTFPEKYSTHELMEIRESMGPYMFSAQFLNNPIPGEVQVFKKEWLQYYDNLLPEVTYRKYLLIDPAVSEKRDADNRAVIVVAVNEAMDWFVLEYVRGNFPLVDNSGRKNLISEIFRLYYDHKPEFVGVEESGFQKALSFLIKQEMLSRDTYFRITPMLPRGKATKAMRIESLAAPFAAGRVYIKQGMHELEDELLGYPMARYKDLIDALSYLVQYAVPPSEPLVFDDNPFLMHNILNELSNKRRSPYPFEEQVAANL